MTIAQTEAGVLSPNGECLTFDASANGYARGEAINAILIKRFDDAVRNRDSIRAVVRSTAVNCDGRSAGLSSPNPKAHERMIRSAYEVGGLVDPSETPYVEVHGTGTPSGDPLELEAIAKVFGDFRDTYIGGIKANVGHGEGASGVTSIIKAVLALENQTIPPQVNFSTPNPRIPFEKARLIVPLEATAWPKDRPKRISVNSFGITGANAHAIIESADSYQQCNVSTGFLKGSDTQRPQLLVFSAANADSLKRRIADLQSYSTSHPKRLQHLAHTLSTGREHLSHRAYTIISESSASEVINSERVKQTPNVSFVFTGQGAQWATMGKGLINDFPSFKQDLIRLNHALNKIPDPPTWDLLDELLNEGLRSRLNKAEFAQPLCTAIQICLVNLLLSLGIIPSAVVGHSSGEIAAAYAAGAITAEEAITIAYYRGLTAISCSKRGAMAAIGIGRAEATLYLEEGVTIACENSPQSVTISGDEESIDSVLEQLKYDDPGVFARRLKTDGMAYHSHHMVEIGPIYEQFIKPLVTAKSPSINFFSSVSGKFLEGNKLGAEYWRQNLESPVRFFPAVKSLIESQGSDQLFLEIGPHSALAGPLRQIFKASSSNIRLSYCPSMVRGKYETLSVLDMCGQLYLQKLPINLELLTLGAHRLTDLPNYPWRHDTSHWVENRVVKEW
jgi:acyl transferase domain-containing protein